MLEATAGYKNFIYLFIFCLYEQLSFNKISYNILCLILCKYKNIQIK